MDFVKESKLKHLTDEKLNEIMDLYYNSDYTVSEIIELFDIKDIRASELYKHFPPIISNDLVCKFCDIHLIQNRKSKSAYSWDQNNFYCPECGHIQGNYCNCDKCKEEYRKEKERIIEQKRRFLNDRIDFKNTDPINIDDLTFKQKVYLGALIRAGIDEDFDNIKPISSFQKKLSPLTEYDEIIFDELYFNKIVSISGKASIDEFNVDYKKDTFSFNWRNIPLIINIYGETSFDEEINKLLNPEIIDKNVINDSLEIWKEIIYWECIELFQYRMNVYDFEYTIGKDSKGFFESTIEKIPISQIYSIIWNAAKNSAAYYQEGNVPKRQAANSTLSRLRNSLDKILSGQWNKYDYTRPKDCPQSVISEYFFNSLLKICDNYWYRIPAIIDLHEDEIPFNDENEKKST